MTQKPKSPKPPLSHLAVLLLGPGARLQRKPRFCSLLRCLASHVASQSQLSHSWWGFSVRASSWSRACDGQIWLSGRNLWQGRAKQQRLCHQCPCRAKSQAPPPRPAKGRRGEEPTVDAVQQLLSKQARENAKDQSEAGRVHGRSHQSYGDV